MLSFRIVNEENKDEILDSLMMTMPQADGEYMSEILDSLLDDTACEYAISSSHGCILVRIFDGKYSFIYPAAVCEESDESLAAYSIREYAVKEEIPLIYTDVPREELSNLIPLFRHANVDAQDEEGEYFTVKIISEAAAFDDIPEVNFEGVTLDEITEADDRLYAKLCKDSVTNEFWGYDYSADNEDPDDSYFREMAENEFSRGVAMAFAVRLDGELVGEASLYAFDLLGGCECAVRILPEHRGKGVATRAINALRSVAERAGLVSLYARVDKNNIPSLGRFEKCFDEWSDLGEIRKFYIKT